MIRVGLPVSSPVVQRRCACGGTPGPDGECAACKAKRLQRQAAGAAPAVAPPVVHEVLGSSGRPLEPGVRGEMEARFGHDFSHVRVHADAQAGESARAVGALAYTVGSHIVFGAGRPAPGTSGTRLLTHELTHVRQQAAGPALPALAAPLAVGEDDSPLEREADAAANAVVGATGAPLTSSPGVYLARQPDEDDEPATTATAPDKTPSRFTPGGFTEKEADLLLQQAQDRAKLGSMALTLAERQARRRRVLGRQPVLQRRRPQRGVPPSTSTGTRTRRSTSASPT